MLNGMFSSVVFNSCTLRLYFLNVLSYMLLCDGTSVQVTPMFASSIEEWQCSQLDSDLLVQFEYNRF